MPLSTNELLDLYENILSERGIGIVVLDESSRLSSMNSMACGMLGITEQNAAGRLSERMLPPELLELLSNGLTKAAEQAEFRVADASGRTVWLRGRVRQLSSSRRCVELQYMRAPEPTISYTEMLNKQQGAMFTFRKIGGAFVHTFCGGKMLDKMGLRSEWIVGKRLEDFLSEEMASQKRLYYERAWSGEENVQFEGKLGSIAYLASLQPIRGSGGDVIEVIASCVEITEQTRTMNALKEAETKYRTLVEEAFFGICMLQDGRLTYANPSMAHIFGYNPGDFIDTPLQQYVVPEDISLLLRNIARLYRGEPGPAIHIKGIRKDGGLVDLEVSGTLITVDDRPAILGILLDVTEKRMTQEMLQKAEKLSVIGQLAAGIAHEIRNPLTSLKGFVQFMKRGRQENPYFDIMLSELERINTIVNELLIVAKPQASQYRRNDLVTIAKDVMTLLESQALLNNVAIRMNHSDEPAVVECEGNQIKQMFINMVKNAIEAMPEGGNVTIEVFSGSSDQVIVLIQDEGCGIPEERLARLGEPFYSTKDKGTGLGLMMCYKIVQEHRGQLRIESKVGKGTCVTIVFMKSMA
ncbi:PAS domain S-box protein [Paenibacillus thermotolerans]|uniref:PAS domain S-box protein n=1 Tax=Paenibacillus thermotolerans TaxID=3027807 RepID=UPI002368EF08|nr:MULTISPECIES: PAS domain S-box protein [unclassified Paenibacillus]